jgi:tetratricopeptide (TPR) repeat protein
MQEITIQQAFELAVQHHQAGRLVEAESIYRQILAKEPMHAESLLHLGVIAHQVGQNDAAVELIRRTLALAPGYPEAYNNLGVVLEAMGQLDEATAAYRQAITLKPEYTDARNNLRGTLRDKGLPNEAIALHEQVRAIQSVKHTPAPDFSTFPGDVPNELRGLSPAELAKTWPSWIEYLDRQVRARVWRGEEDTLANYLLLGTGYTREPRITDAYRADLVRQFGREEDADSQVKSVIMTRAHDLARALAVPDEDERLLTALEIVNRAGHAARTPESQAVLAQYLFDNLVRYLDDARAFAAGIAATKSIRSGIASLPVANLYQTRGLSTDTTILVDCALDRGLQEIKKSEFLPTGSVRRAAVIGVGLDIIDKLGGYDLHPPQITQPILLLDTLLKLELAHAGDLEITILDISTRVIQHVERAVARAENDQCYPLNLIRDSALGWSEEAVRFWETCGDRVGNTNACGHTPGCNGVSGRSIQVRPEWIAKIHPVNFNIVCEQIILSEDERFDLLVATNVLCYYDSFQQGLALRNAAGMLRPGGMLLTTEELAGVESTDMNLLLSTYVETSINLGYRIFCYIRSR